MILLAVAAFALSETHKRDVRCVWVVSQASFQAEEGQEKLAFASLRNWYEGRLSARQPDLVVQAYVDQNFVFRVRTH